MPGCTRAAEVHLGEAARPWCFGLWAEAVGSRAGGEWEALVKCQAVSPSLGDPTWISQLAHHQVTLSTRFRSLQPWEMCVTPAGHLQLPEAWALFPCTEQEIQCSLGTCSQEQLFSSFSWSDRIAEVGLWVQTASPCPWCLLIWTSGERPRVSHLSQVPGWPLLVAVACARGPP